MHMINPLIEGVVLGLTLAILIGPAFFALLQTSIVKGFKSGIYLALGIFLSDSTLVLVTYFGLSHLIDFQHEDLFFGIIGGVILVVFGSVTFTRKPTTYIEEDTSTNGYLKSLPNPLKQILKGYFLNMFNPFLIIWWMTIVVGVSSNYSNDTYSIYVFFGSVLFTILLTDIAKVYVAGRLKEFVKPGFITWVNRLVGIMLVVFGLILIFRVVYMYR